MLNGAKLSNGEIRDIASYRLRNVTFNYARLGKYHMLESNTANIVAPQRRGSIFPVTDKDHVQGDAPPAPGSAASPGARRAGRPERIIKMAFAPSVLPASLFWRRSAQ
jgi:hypothetical protein